MAATATSAGDAFGEPGWRLDRQRGGQLPQPLVQAG
jgi:hypothetical protein